MNPTSEDSRCYAALAEKYRTLIESDTAAIDESQRFRKLLIDIVQSYLDDLELAAMTGMRIDALETRLAGIEARADAKKRLVTEAMTRSGLRTLSAPGIFVERLEVPPPLVIDSEAAIPARFWTEGAAELDRNRILAALRAGEAVAGVQLGRPETTIVVRSR